MSSSSSKQPTKKRARGLAAASSSKTKKAKKADEVEEEQGIENAGETWADLKELWENAFDAFSGEDPASAAPLLRGLMFECDRIVRNSVDALHPLQTSQPSDKPEASSSDAAQDDAAAGLSLERFYLIYGTSVYALGQLIYLSSELALSSEPSPEAFFGKALDFLLTAPTSTDDDEAPLLEHLRAAKQGDWQAQLARARAVVGLLAAAGTSDAEEEVLAEDEVAPLLAWATATTEAALKHVGALPLPDAPAEGEVAPPAQRDPATTFLPTPPTAEQRLNVRHAAAAAIAGLVESLPPSAQAECARWAEAQFGQVKMDVAALLPAESSTERHAWDAKVLVARGGVRLSLGAAQAEEVIESEAGSKSKPFKAVERLLQSALDDLTAARALRPQTPAAPAPSAPEGDAPAQDDEDEDELAALVVEACLTLVGLYESLGDGSNKEAAIEALEGRARAEGWEGYGEEDRSDGDDD